MQSSNEAENKNRSAKKVAVPEPTPAVPSSRPESTGGTLVLQWLSYAFWGWFGAILAVLAGITFGYFLNGPPDSNFAGALAYPLAGVIVMAIVALVTDIVYSKREAPVKQTAATVIMLIHVVIYALTVISALITVVFGLVNLLLVSGNDPEGPYIVMLTAGVVVVTYGLITLRVLFGAKKRLVRPVMWAAMMLLAVVFIVMSVVGPVVQAAATKDDRLIESALPALADNIEDYTRDNDKLPTDLSQVRSSSGSYNSTQVKQLIDKRLVTYKPETTPVVEPLPAPENQITDDMLQKPVPTQKRFKYQLCVVYKEANGTSYDYDSSYGGDNYVTSRPSTYSHDKGEVCYKLVVSGKYPQLY